MAEVKMLIPLSNETLAFLARPVHGHVIGDSSSPSLSGEVFDVFDPATNERIAVVAAGRSEDVDVAVTAARESFENGRWRRLPPAEKEHHLRALLGLVESSSQMLTELEVLDNGRPIRFARRGVMLASQMIGYYAGWPTKIQGSVIPTSDDMQILTTREAIGVCACIVPWNGPFVGAVAKVLPAIACGNSVVLKPSDETPLTAIVLAELCLKAGIPPGVVNVVQGTGAVTGAALVVHPGVDKVAFTGSTATGRLIHAATADSLKLVSLELGGKSPNIVFADSDLDAATVCAANAIWANSGQICFAGSRLLVERSVHDEVVAGVIAASEGLRVGSGFDPTSDLGPLISAKQFDKVTSYIHAGVSEGAKLAFGGGRVGEVGHFVSPTVFTNVDNDMRIAREEIFGPVLSVIPFDDEEEAFRIANDTQYGLAAGVWTTNLARAHRATQALRAGIVWVNTYLEMDFGAPFGGFKQSGYGREYGSQSIDLYTETKTTFTRFVS